MRVDLEPAIREAEVSRHGGEHGGDLLGVAVQEGPRQLRVVGDVRRVALDDPGGLPQLLGDGGALFRPNQYAVNIVTS
ncbi:MAG: hypothetical protein QNJ12_16260 [Ilumatobacter sp.]|uniref:hypothetical protein n=1 Tax=Ilumatobacter sp. TaxID=1967498 RepID=UPI00262DE9EE|nr:hypothetical protein [Ilumatobacter sp.]MDJ0770353.1 hypothetical protein [Ilumatobacter sp.]